MKICFVSFDLILFPVPAWPLSYSDFQFSSFTQSKILKTQLIVECWNFSLNKIIRKRCYFCGTESMPVWSDTLSIFKSCTADRGAQGRPLTSVVLCDRFFCSMIYFRIPHIYFPSELWRWNYPNLILTHVFLIRRISAGIEWGLSEKFTRFIKCYIMYTLQVVTGVYLYTLRWTDEMNCTLNIFINDFEKLLRQSANSFTKHLQQSVWKLLLVFAYICD